MIFLFFYSNINSTAPCKNSIYREGKLPTTDQVTHAIESVQSSDAFHEASRGMSPLGKKVLVDTERLLDTTKKIFEEKNVGDELQQVIYHTGKATKDTACESSI
jgi:hypothetical protein